MYKGCRRKFVDYYYRSRTCDGVERIERGGAHEVHRYVHQDSHRPRDKDGTRDGDRPIPATSERCKKRLTPGIGMPLLPRQSLLRFGINHDQRPTCYHSTPGTKKAPEIAVSEAFICMSSQVSLAGVVRDAEGLERTLRDIGPHQVEGCISRKCVTDTAHIRAVVIKSASCEIPELLELHLSACGCPTCTLLSAAQRKRAAKLPAMEFFSHRTPRDWQSSLQTRKLPQSRPLLPFVVVGEVPSQTGKKESSREWNCKQKAAWG